MRCYNFIYLPDNLYIMLLTIDGVRYHLYTPSSETELENYVAKHSQEIFGEGSFYFNIKKNIQTVSGIATIPDGYVIATAQPASWYIVEVELSSHSVYKHIIPQVTKFISAWNNDPSKGEIVKSLYSYIDSDVVLKVKFQQAIKNAEIHKFLSELIASEPVLAIIIDDKHSSNVEEASRSLKIETLVIELQTYARENSNNSVLAHIIDSPLYKERIIAEEESIQEASGMVSGMLGGRKIQVSIEQVLKATANPNIHSYWSKHWYAEINGKNYPVKGLLSLATGIPVTDFNTVQALHILKKLGLKCHELR